MASPRRRPPAPPSSGKVESSSPPGKKRKRSRGGHDDDDDDDYDDSKHHRDWYDTTTDTDDGNSSLDSSSFLKPFSKFSIQQRQQQQQLYRSLEDYHQQLQQHRTSVGHDDPIRNTRSSSTRRIKNARAGVAAAVDNKKVPVSVPPSNKTPPALPKSSSLLSDAPQSGNTAKKRKTVQFEDLKISQKDNSNNIKDDDAFYDYPKKYPAGVILKKDKKEEQLSTGSDVRCKFAKAGCPFQGTSKQVQSHEDTYCRPLYTQLAHYKMYASQLRTQIEQQQRDLDSNNKRQQQQQPTVINSRHVSPPLSPTRTSHHPLQQSPVRKSSPPKSLSVSPGKGVPAGLPSKACSPPLSTSVPTAATFVESLQMQIQRLQRDLSRTQAQLETEKNLRTERLRKASERCMELMSISELGEGKAEVLRMKLAAERELREKLEDELETQRATAALAQEIRSSRMMLG